MERWKNVTRPYTEQDVEILRGSLQETHTLAKYTAEKLWESINSENYVHAMGAVTGNQAMQMVKAGVPAIYCSGWQVAADANDSHEMYPDQSLYAVHSVPMLVQKINNSLRRADQIEWVENDGKAARDWFAPIVADAEAGFGGPLNAFELMKSMIRAGAAGVHFEDQLSSAKKCGHLGGKVLVPASEFVRKLISARLAADVMGTPTVLIARTDANSARLLTTDVDERDKQFITSQERTPEGFFQITGGIDMAIDRGLQYAPYADLLWCETSKPDLTEAKKFADAIHEKFPNQLLAYNCSPSFNWKKNLDDETIAKFQRELGAMGYKFQFITLAGFHNLNYHMFRLAKDYQSRDMSAYADLQEREFWAEHDGYTATKHQREVGTGYFDAVAQVVSGGTSSTLALKESTEAEQF
ncbi:MAG TPA: isocitrate lyase [Cytophagales bacterium]|nr:isocitrate lyase [Cytophagales bacterium]|tara:strand:+ start:243 stop:1478 length:1236 start_codon:yes stop_codon:yes gene_type:complete